MGGGPRGSIIPNVSLLAVSREFGILQLGLVTRSGHGRDQFAEVETLILSLDSGRILARQRDLPRFVYVREQVIYALQRSSPPVVTAYGFHFSRDDAR